MKLVILGGPGSGKGTQAERLCRRLSVPCISVGEILRQAIASRTDLGIEAQSYVEKGELVPDPVLIGFIRQRLLQSDVDRGWLLDGYPRTAFQAEELDFLLADLGQHLNWAVWLDLPELVMKNRSIARSRQDDRPEIVQRRLELFQERTVPILEYYEHGKRLLTVNGDQYPELVEQEILQKLNLQ